MKTATKMRIQLTLLAALLANAVQYADAQGSLFNYQGRLSDNGAPANGSYDLKFTVYDGASGGTASRRAAREGLRDVARAQK